MSRFIGIFATLIYCLLVFSPEKANGEFYNDPYGKECQKKGPDGESIPGTSIVNPSNYCPKLSLACAAGEGIAAGSGQIYNCCSRFGDGNLIWHSTPTGCCEKEKPTMVDGQCCATGSIIENGACKCPVGTVDDGNGKCEDCGSSGLYIYRPSTPSHPVGKCECISGTTTAIVNGVTIEKCNNHCAIDEAWIPDLPIVWISNTAGVQGHCEKICGDGDTWYPLTGTKTKTDYVCCGAGSGSSFNPTLQRCQCDPATPLPSGNGCVACPAGSNWNGSTCLTCPTGSTYNSTIRNCQCNPDTPVPNGAGCEACPSGSTWNGSSCVYPTTVPCANPNLLCKTVNPPKCYTSSREFSKSCP